MEDKSLKNVYLNIQQFTIPFTFRINHRTSCRMINVFYYSFELPMCNVLVSKS